MSAGDLRAFFSLLNTGGAKRELARAAPSPSFGLEYEHDAGCHSHAATNLKMEKSTLTTKKWKGSVFSDTPELLEH